MISILSIHPKPLLFGVYSYTCKNYYECKEDLHEWINMANQTHPARIR